MIALVPMKHSSERVPQKNYRNLNGRPVFHYILETLSQCSIDKIVVDTDSPVIKDGIENFFPHVQVIDRPKHLRDGHTSMNEIIAYDMTQLDDTCFLQTHCTNPLLRPQTVDCAIKLFENLFPKNDSLFSVTPVQKRFWFTSKLAVNHNPRALLRTQDLPRIYEENSCIYIFTSQSFGRRNNRLGRNPVMFMMDPIEAWDIDTMLDFKIVEFLCREGFNESIDLGSASNT